MIDFNPFALRRGFALALALVLGAPLHASADPQPVPLPLWEVTHEGRTLYLMGSVHMLHPEAYPLDDALYEAFDAADIVAFELDLNDMARAMPQMVQKGMMDEGRTLRDVVTAETWSQLEVLMSSFGLPIQVIEGMQPWLVAMMIHGLALERGGFDAEHGIDLHFHHRAEAAGMRILGLETVEEQIDVFVAGGMEVQLGLLESTLDQLEDAVAYMNRITDLWQRGDAEGIAKKMYDSMSGQPELMERLLYQRNRNWMPAIEAMLATPETGVVIVGMGHLVGPGSVVELLRERGYEVVQLQSVTAEAAP